MTRRILAASALLAAMVWCASAMAQKAPAGAGGQVMAAKADPALPPVYTDPGEIPRLTMAGDAKRALMDAITDAMHEHIGAPRESVRVWINEFPKTRWW